MLRRTKQMTDVDGRKIGDLAAADVRVIRIELSEAERHFYNALYSRSKQRFQSLIASKQNAAQNYTLILTLLTRLRQACDHPFLLVGGRGGGKGATAAAAAAASAASAFAANGGDSAFSAAVTASLNGGGDDDEEEGEALDPAETTFSPAMLQHLYWTFVHTHQHSLRGAGGGREEPSTRRPVGPADGPSSLAASPLLDGEETEDETAAPFTAITSAVLSAGMSEPAPSSLAPTAAHLLEDGSEHGSAFDDGAPATESAAATAALAVVPPFPTSLLPRAALPWCHSSKLAYLLSDLREIQAHNERCRGGEGSSAAAASSGPMGRYLEPYSPYAAASTAAGSSSAAALSDTVGVGALRREARKRLRATDRRRGGSGGGKADKGGAKSKSGGKGAAVATSMMMGSGGKKRKATSAAAVVVDDDDDDDEEVVVIDDDDEDDDDDATAAATAASDDDDDSDISATSDDHSSDDSFTPGQQSQRAQRRRRRPTPSTAASSTSGKGKGSTTGPARRGGAVVFDSDDDKDEEEGDEGEAAVTAAASSSSFLRDGGGDGDGDDEVIVIDDSSDEEGGEEGTGVDGAARSSLVTSSQSQPPLQLVAGLPLLGPTKVVVFSSFTSFLDCIQRALGESRILCARLDGSMSKAAREAALATFRTDPAVNVFLLSLKAGGTGLNLQVRRGVCYFCNISSFLFSYVRCLDCLWRYTFRTE